VLGVLIIHQLSGLSSSQIPCAYWPGQPQVSSTEQYNLRFSPRPRQTLVYSLQSRMESEGEGYLGKSLTLSAQADGEMDGAIVMRKAGSRIMEWPFRLTANAGLLLLEWR